VTGAVLLDAAGTELGQAYVDGPAADSRLIARPSTVLSVGSGRAAVRVVAGATVTQLSSHKYACVGVELGRQHSRCDDDADDADANTVTARVSCATRRTVVFGIARHTISRVELTLSNGRRVRARLAAFPRGLGSRNKVFLAVLPRHVAITRVHFVGPHAHGSATTAALPTRAPSRQCGYETTNALF
jgi:hypothetical protein